MQERRNATRWRIDKRVKIKLENTEDFQPCYVKDISFKGMQISLEEKHKLKKDVTLKLTLFLADEFILDIIRVWVVWSKGVDGHSICGLYFSKISDSAKEKIYQFMRRYFSEVLVRQWWQDIDKGGEVMREENFEDKRVFERFPVKLPMRLIDLDSNRECQAQSQDISAKGIGLVTEAKLLPKSPLEIWLEIPDKMEPLYARGEVVWAKAVNATEYKAGINLEKADLMGMARALRVGQ